MVEYKSLRLASRTSFLASGLIYLAASSTALAGTPNADNLASPGTADPAIFGGEGANICAWPTVVSVGGCTATLIHPEIILYAAHCGGGNKTARFGNSSSGSFNVGTQYCRTYPDYLVTGDEHIDWAFCRLDYAVDIPIAPPVMGCEWDELKADDDVAIVGYGQTYDGGGGGGKRWAITKLIGVSLPGNIAEVGGQGGAGSCPGDSGGPAFKRYADGSWHQFGIVSTGTADSCDETTQHFYSLVRNAIPWVEEESGIDVTPCTDAYGIWDAGPNCTNFFSSEAGAAFGSWNDGCTGGPTSGPSNTCGPSNGAPQDVTAPSISITNPLQGDSFPNPSEVLLEMDAQDESPLKGIRLEIDGTDIGVSTIIAPYQFTLNFSADAVYSIQAIAEDWSGNLGYSNTIEVAVGNVNPPDPTTTGASSETSSGNADTSETSDAGEVGTESAGEDEGGASAGTESTTASFDEGGTEESGCACTSSEDSRGSGLAWAAMVMVMVGGRRRPRSA